MRMISPFHGLASCLLVSIAMTVPARAQVTEAQPLSSESPVVSSRVTQAIDDTKLVRLAGNTHPSVDAHHDLGPLSQQMLLNRLVLVLKRSPEQEAALAAFNERQYDPNSPDFHRWLHAEEFGKLYGPSDSDIAAVSSWLQNNGFQISQVSKGRVWIEFNGTVAQVQNAFHVEMHRYLADGKEHISNDRDPAIPEALAPVVEGIASLNDFFPKHYSHPGNFVKRDLKTGKYAEQDLGAKPISGLKTEGSFKGGTSPSGPQPEFGYVDPNTGYQREMLGPYDVATIYNILPLWSESTPINGKGVKVAIVGLSDVETSDFNTYRSSFGLPAGTLTTVHSGTDPGLTDSQGENTEDTEMVSATAPGAQIILVSDVNNATTNGLITAVTYITENETAPILTMSYGACELKMGSSGNSLFNKTFQQAATAGISSFVAAGDSGSGVCTSQNGNPPYGDTYGLAVSGMASTPYVTAVGGTDLQWPFSSNAYTTYWNTTANSHGATAKGYMPEMSWNDTCSNPVLLNVFTAYSNVESLCNAAINGDPGLVEMGAGSGGVSNCTTPTGSTISSCAGGYAKPSWQTGVTGIPADGKRDLPDVSMFAAYGFQSSTGIPGSALLICQASNSPEKSCDYSNPDYIIYQENGGTSAASPLTAGIMALVLQKTGAKQGLANPVFYSLAAKENYSSCNSNTVKAGNSCIFYDTTTGSNAAVCITGDTNCVTKTSGDEAGILSGYNATVGYDRTTGLGTFNVTNLVNAWPVTGSAPKVTLSPTSLTFASTKVGATSAAQTVTVKNTGNATLTLTSETITGVNIHSFVISANTCGASLAAGASCTVSVELKPVSTGSLTASLSVADNATGSPQAVAMAGTAVAAAAVTLSPTSLTFASTKVGSTAAAQTVTVKNTGTGTVTLTSETITGVNIHSFVISSNKCGSTLAAGASCTVSIELKPVSSGTLTASLSVADNATGSPQTVAMTGIAVAAPVVALSPASLTFAATKVGSTSAAQAVTVKNTGDATLNLTSETITGVNVHSYVISAKTCGSTLAAGASCTVSVELKPVSAGTVTASLSIADNAANSPQTVTMTGTATGPAISLSPTTVSFATTKKGSTSAAQMVTLKNTGTGTMNLTSETITGTDASSFIKSATTCGTTLAAGASCTVSVEFKPAATGSLAASLSVSDNAAGSPQAVKLSGAGD